MQHDVEVFVWGMIAGLALAIVAAWAGKTAGEAIDRTRLDRHDDQ